MMNGSVSIAECKPSRTKGKNISVLKQSTSLLSHLFNSLQSRPNADIDEFSLDSIDMAGAMHGLCQMNIRKHTTQTRGLTSTF